MKICPRCSELKSLDDFYNHRNRPDGKGAICIECCKRYQYANRKEHSQTMQRYRDRNKSIEQNERLSRKYDITLYEYNELLKKQKGVCAICKQPPSDRRLCVDHNHNTGVIRGLLCVECNNGLSKFKDDSEILKTATKYLETEPEGVNLLGLFSQLGVRIG